jgi:hypothetical protein
MNLIMRIVLAFLAQYICVANAEILAEIELQASSAVKIKPLLDSAELQQAGWRNYQLIIRNPARQAGTLTIGSPNAQPLFSKSSGGERALPENEISSQQVLRSTIELLPEPGLQLTRALSGEPVERRDIQIYTRHQGKLEVELVASFVPENTEKPHSGHAVIPFEILPASRVQLVIRDELDRPAFAAITITDGVNRLVLDPAKNPLPANYRYRFAMRRPWERIWEEGAYRNSASPEPHLTGIYPFPARRLPQLDPFPDLYFQAQIYRGDGEYIYLPPGRYRVDYNGGPETLSRSREVIIEAQPAQLLRLDIEPWINMEQLGWFSGDLHVHASGCKHIESPRQGVLPELLLRQARGEGLNVVSVLNWVPGWQEQLPYFGQTYRSGNTLLHHDMEVSNFPSNAMGHLGLWNLPSPNYPDTARIADWPSWNLPILRWAREKLATTGYLHAGWGMQPHGPQADLPNFALAPMSGIGANDYVVALNEDLVDLLGVGDTPPTQELNLWYHTLNSGYRTRIMGESDFPCIYHEKIGIARSYAKLEEELGFDAYLSALRAGRSYVSDGKSHLIDFTVNGQELGVAGSQIQVRSGDVLNVRARAAAWLPESPSAIEMYIAQSDEQRQPAWDIARARIPGSRNVTVELVMNGEAVAAKSIKADGSWTDIDFDVPVTQSSWLALRIFPSSHSNPIFVQVEDTPVRASAASATWLARALVYLWQTKSSLIHLDEREEAKTAYERARAQYLLRAQEASADD